jgi:Protein of unknown function (DUF3465)
VKKLLPLVALFLSAYLLFNFYPEIIDRFDSSQVQNPANNSRIRQAFENRQSDVQVRGEGTVVAILSDDTKGSRHQRFIVKLSSGQTVLIAHNIDLAPRIGSLAKGDAVEFYGEYEWNEKGGVIHWTHHDPNGRHEDGWLIHRGRKYG